MERPNDDLDVLDAQLGDLTRELDELDAQLEVWAREIPNLEPVTEEDEPLFAPAEPSSPVIQGLTVIEEARDPLGDERPLPPPLPPFRSFVETTPAFVRVSARKINPSSSRIARQ